ncbi:TetR/AcrR family transcriptional regulator [Mycobacterium marseillense]|uniref:TetR/AcrR family transcriptional regulator n=1 Tax=Mycobacterium marseillense TaxID=701042 RepID=UPI0015D30A63|nr:TetR/AcrR family transcriptional regulator [Mycobacterium marseillense]
MTPKPAAPAALAREGVWDRRRRLVAAEIEQVALRLFAQQGYDNVTTDDIAQACNISARTLFRYFAAKRDLLLAVPRRSLALLCDAVERRPADEDLLTSWREAAIALGGGNEVDLALIEQLKTLVRDNPDLVETINGDAELTERFVRTNAERLGVDPATDLRPIIVAGAVRNALIATLDQWSSGRADDLVRSFGEAFDILARLDAIGGRRAGKTSRSRTRRT